MGKTMDAISFSKLLIKDNEQFINDLLKQKS